MNDRPFPAGRSDNASPSSALVNSERVARSAFSPPSRILETAPDPPVEFTTNLQHVEQFNCDASAGVYLCVQTFEIPIWRLHCKTISTQKHSLVSVLQPEMARSVPDAICLESVP